MDTYGDFYTPSVDPSVGMGIAATVIGILFIVLAIAAVIGIIVIIAEWKIFKKAGQEGWKAIIPFNKHWLFDIDGKRTGDYL